jgi:hypothetical protein
VAHWHLHELEERLARRGWQVREVRRGESDRWGLSGSWELVRGERRVWLDFKGGDADGLTTHPIEHAYACELRDQPAVSIYFAKKKSIAAWRAELAEFVQSLDAATGA